MSTQPNLTEQDYELLSTYLDGELNEGEKAALETRLAADEQLRAELEALRQTVALVSSVRLIRAPRNYALTANMIQSPRWLVFPTTTAFSALAAAAALLLIFFGTTLLIGQSTAPLLNSSPLASNFERDQEAQVAIQPTLANIQATQVDVYGGEVTASTVIPPFDGAVPQPEVAVATGFFSEESSSEQAATLIPDALEFAPPGALTAISGQLQFAAPTSQPTPTQAVEPLAASGAANAASPQEAASGEDVQENAPDAAMVDEAALAATDTGSADREAVTATSTELPTASPTQSPTATLTYTPSPAFTSTPPPTATIVPTTAPIPKTVGNVENWLAPGLLLLGILLLVVAGVTTWIRIRRR
jgi:anti-sigma factor RsiW